MAKSEEAVMLPTEAQLLHFIGWAEARGVVPPLRDPIGAPIAYLKEMEKRKGEPELIVLHHDLITHAIRILYLRGRQWPLAGVIAELSRVHASERPYDQEIVGVLSDLGVITEDEGATLPNTWRITDYGLRWSEVALKIWQELPCALKGETNR